jgi:hypothetical protein
MLPLPATLRSPLTSPFPTPWLPASHSANVPLTSHPLYGFAASFPAPAVPLLPQIAVRGKSPNTFSRPCSPVPLVSCPPAAPGAPGHPIGQRPHQSLLAVLTSSCSSRDGVGVRERVRTLGSRGNEKPLRVPHLSHPDWGLPGLLHGLVRGEGRLLSVTALLPSPPCRAPASLSQGGISRLEAPKGPNRLAWSCPTPHHDPLVAVFLAGLSAPAQLGEQR